MSKQLNEEIIYRLYETEMSKIINECVDNGIDLDQLTEQELNELFGGVRQRFGNLMRGQGFKTDKDALHAHRMRHDRTYRTEVNTKDQLARRRRSIESLKARGGSHAKAAEKMNPDVIKRFNADKVTGRGKNKKRGGYEDVGGKDLAKALNPYQAGNRETRKAGHPGGSKGRGKFRSGASIESASKRNRARAERRWDLHRKGKLKDPGQFQLESIINRVTSILLEMRLDERKKKSKSMGCMPCKHGSK